MCLAKQGKIISVENGKAIVEFKEGKTEAIAKDIKLKKGDEVLVQFGIVIQKISQKA